MSETREVIERWFGEGIRKYRETHPKRQILIQPEQTHIDISPLLNDFAVELLIPVADALDLLESRIKKLEKKIPSK